MIEWIIKNKEWIFSGIGLSLITSMIGILIKFIRRKITKEPLPQIGPGSYENVIDTSAAGKISAESITCQHHKIPISLARPNFLISQSGFCGRMGIAPEYTFKIFNTGGSCFNVRICHNKSTEEYVFPQLPRGRHNLMRTSFRDETGTLLITINALDENGKEYKQIIHGIRHVHNYEFS